MQNRATYPIMLAVILLLIVVLSVGFYHKTHISDEHSHETESCQLCIAFNNILPFLGAAVFFFVATVQVQKHQRYLEPKKVFSKLRRFYFHSGIDPPVAS